MKIFLGILHILLAIVLTIVVLLQQRREGGFSGVFGGGAQANAKQWQRFSGLTKLTIVLASLFMISSLFLALIR
ncbi:MAG: preprotein translocase subunit SecG [Fretibacterium sp.]|nr:preprotein translocase subunit SecG [Fretibacterium sp.]